MKHGLWGRSSGLVVSVFTFYSVNLNSNTVEVYNFFRDKTKMLSRIQTRIVGVDGHHTDH